MKNLIKVLKDLVGKISDSRGFKYSIIVVAIFEVIIAAIEIKYG